MEHTATSATAALPVEAIRRCATDEGFLTAVERLYCELDRRIAARGPVCLNRGACCRFSQYGHRLYVTPVELAYFLARLADPVRGPGAAGACPYAREGRCEARPGRPTGCRIFYCDPISQAWQPVLTETTLADLKELHHRFDLAYAYMDWTRALRA